MEGKFLDLLSRIEVDPVYTDSNTFINPFQKITLLNIPNSKYLVF